MNQIRQERKVPVFHAWRNISQKCLKTRVKISENSVGFSLFRLEVQFPGNVSASDGVEIYLQDTSLAGEGVLLAATDVCKFITFRDV